MFSALIVAELLVVGLGTSMWMFLFYAALVRFNWVPLLLTSGVIGAGSLVALLYVIGIVTDRLVREWLTGAKAHKIRAEQQRADQESHRLRLGALERWPFLEFGNADMFYEKIIRNTSRPLSEQINYNRTRLRICRSWAWHFVLIAATFGLWDARTHVLTIGRIAAVLIPSAILSFATWRAYRLLELDHRNTLYESIRMLLHDSTPRM